MSRWECVFLPNLLLPFFSSPLLFHLWDCTHHCWEYAYKWKLHSISTETALLNSLSVFKMINNFHTYQWCKRYLTALPLATICSFFFIVDMFFIFAHYDQCFLGPVQNTCLIRLGCNSVVKHLPNLGYVKAWIWPQNKTPQKTKQTNNDNKKPPHTHKKTKQNNPA